MAIQKTNQIRLEENNFKRLKSLAKSNKLGLKLPKLANIAVERGFASLLREVGK